MTLFVMLYGNKQLQKKKQKIKLFNNCLVPGQGKELNMISAIADWTIPGKKVKFDN